MIHRSFSITVSQPYLSLLELEAKGSGRGVEEHIAHILGRRFDNILRVCSCGYFIYAQTDDLRCCKCSNGCCPYCSIPQDNRDLCFSCARKQGIATEGLGGFRAAPEGKV